MVTKTPGPGRKATNTPAKGAKATRKLAVAGPRPQTRRARARWQREQRLIRGFTIGIALVAVLAITIIAVGVWQVFIAPGRESIARFGNRELSVDEYSHILEVRQAELDREIAANGGNNPLSQRGGPAQYLLQQRSTLPTQVVFDWADDQLIRQEAARRGITASPDEITKQIRYRLDPYAVVTEEPPKRQDGQSDDEYNQTLANFEKTKQERQTQFVKDYGQFLKDSHISEDDYRKLAEGDVLKDKLTKALQAEMPTQAPQVHVQGILLDKEEEAKTVKDRLAGGEDITKLANELTKDTNSKDKGGDLGWFPKRVKDVEIDEAVFAMNVGDVSQPVKTSQGFWVFKLLEKDDNRLIDDDNLSTLKNKELRRWLDTKKKDNKDIEYKITSEKQYWAQDRIDKRQPKNKTSSSSGSGGLPSGAPKQPIIPGQ